MAGATSIAELMGGLDFDPATLKTKYLAERDKRLRTDANDQYVEVTAEFSQYVDDPYVTPGFTREPLLDRVEMAVIGGGFGGLLMAARMKEAGFDDIRVIEKAGDFGGTWYWNRYPGAMCDVESYCYLPLLEELNYIPEHKYSFAPEILEHSRRIARNYDLYDNACLQTSITNLSWDETTEHWIIETDRGDKMRARYVAMANGPLSRPKLPGIQGINDYQGHTFHTSRWDYAYTGGDSYGNLTNLRDKRVGIIGTGATAVQCIPHLGEWAKELYIFQRTPSSIDVRNNAKTDAEWAAGLKPGWQKERMDNFNILVSGGDQDEDLINDGWTDIFRNLTGIAAKLASRQLGRRLTKAERAELMELSDYKKMNFIRARAEAVVKDPSVAESLKPWYRQFCKRPCFHDEYLNTYNRDNVTLVDTQGKGVDGLTQTGVQVGGNHYEVDCLIFATGFEVGTTFTRRAGYDIIGRGGHTLSEHWADGLRTFHGLTSHGFPNCFFLGFTQTAVTVNVPHALNEQAKHLAHVLSRARQQGAPTVEATAEAENEYVELIQQSSTSGSRFYRECTPGYYNSEGKSGNNSGFFSDMFGGSPIKFFRMLEDWRADGSMQGLELR